MTVQNRDEKIAFVKQLLKQADMETFQVGLAIECAATPTGNAVIDEQFRVHAQNAECQLVAVLRKEAVLRAALAALEQEPATPAP